MKQIFLAVAALLLMANSPDEIDALIAQESYDEAFAMAQEGAKSGDPLMSTYLAWMYDKGYGTEQDLAKAAEIYREAAAGGNNFARWRLGVMIDMGEAEGTLEEAFELFRAGAQEDYLNAISSLAVMHATGRGTPQNYGAAMDSYKHAARLGDAHGFQGVGVLYVNGEGVEADTVEAMAWWLVALSLGNDTASANYQRVSPTLEDSEVHAIYKRANEIAEEYGLEQRFTPWDE